MADSRQVRLAWNILFQPGRWKKGSDVKKLEDALSNQFGGPARPDAGRSGREAFTFSSGRESLLAILKALHYQRDEEVIVQGYTCVVVPNAIIAAGMVPVYADIERDTLNIDLDDLEAKITPKTRAIICQHTFGIPAFTKRLRDMCDRHSLALIEDCAHIMPDASGPKEIGHLGDVMFCSFGRDKAISGVAGGAVICTRKDICEELSKLYNDAQDLGLIRIKMFVLYPILYALAKPIYGLGIGKALLVIASKLKMLVPILTRSEKAGKMQAQLHRIPNACAALALDQLHRLKEINDHRRMLTKFYFDEGTKHNWPMLLGVTPDLPLQKFPLFVDKAERIRQQLKKHNIHLHDGWTGCVICPAAADGEAVGYKDGQDPDAEMAGEQILSLPTHPTTTLTQAKELVQTLNPLLSK